MVPRVLPMAGSIRWMGTTSEMKVPNMGDSISEGTIVEWAKAEGDWADEDDVIAVVETDKVTVEIRAEKSGFVRSHKASEGDTIEVGAPLCEIEEGERPEGAGGEKEKPKESSGSSSSSGGGGGDSKKASEEPPKKKEEPPKKKDEPKKTEMSSATMNVGGASREERRVKMSRMRARIAERLKDAQNTAAMLTTFQECDMGELIAMRKRHKDEFEAKHGVKLGFMSPFIKASAAALQEVPAVNARIEGGDIVYSDFVDVSVAVASPRGLVVPVIRNVEQMSFAEVELELASLANKAREDKIAMEDMAGGTFTVSNGGVFGSLLGTPIINSPQSAILGMHATKERAVVVNGQIVSRPVMFLALTYDHRLIDGREAVTALKSIRDKIEDPTRLLLDL